MISEETKDRYGLACVLCDIANVCEKQTKLAEAEQLLSQAVTIFEELVGRPYIQDVWAQEYARRQEDARKQLDKIRELQQIASQK
jgi:hypothetical protein